MNVDFARLGLKDALDLAIQLEGDARDRYVELAGQLRIHQRSPKVIALFESLAQLEEGHRAVLVEARRQRFGAEPRTLFLAELDEGIEGVRIDDARVKLSLRDALEAALEAEERAKAFFERGLLQVKDPEVSRLFAELRDEEGDHRAQLGVQLEQLPEAGGGQQASGAAASSAAGPR